MNSPSTEWGYLQAGEYVLGTLSDAELIDFSEQLKQDEVLQQWVVEWQEKLQPLALTNQVVTPPERVWRNINAHLRSESDNNAYMPAKQRRPDNNRLAAQPDKHISDLRKQLSRQNNQLLGWKWAASLAMAASVILAVGLWDSDKPSTQQPVETAQSIGQEYEAISVISAEDSGALWVVDVSLQNQQIRVTAINPPASETDQDHQLWLVKPDNSGVQSLGLLPKNSRESVELNAPLLQNDAVALAVSLEQLGGSAQVVPTGPVLYQGEFNLIEYK